MRTIGVYTTTIRLLRGEYNSVRYRFFTLPNEWMRYILWYRLRGKDWTAFYRDRMNDYAAISRNVRPAEAYLEGGSEHLEHLKAFGMRPHHRMLDYGCGTLRTAHFAVPYLDTGNYVGVDIADIRIEKGRALLAEFGIAPDSYEAFTVSDCELRELEGYSFDYIWAQSVLTHMPAREIRTMLRAMKRLLAPWGVFVFTFSTDSRYKRRNIKDFRYPESFMERECRAAGYHYDLIERGRVNHTRMVRLTLSEKCHQ